MNNVKAAAERLRRLYAGVPYRVVYKCEQTLGGHQQRDERKVLDAVMPWLDEQSVDEAWLRAVGFVETSDWSDGPQLGIVSITGDEVWLDDGNSGIKRACKVKTRGDVRRLCACLGITLEEPQ